MPDRVPPRRGVDMAGSCRSCPHCRPWRGTDRFSIAHSAGQCGALWISPRGVPTIWCQSFSARDQHLYSNGIEGEGGHSSDPHISRMISFNGLLSVRSRMARASSSVRVDCDARRFSSGLSSITMPVARSTARRQSRSLSGSRASVGSSASPPVAPAPPRSLLLSAPPAPELSPVCLAALPQVPGADSLR